MKIGVPAEVKSGEKRVAVTPAGVADFVKKGHTVFVQAGAGEASGFTDEEYKKAGAKILQTAKEVWDKADMIQKVKEPVQTEYGLIKTGQTIFTYFHLSGVDPELTKVLLEKHVTAIAYETVQTNDGGFPLLAPMSRVAGCLAITKGGNHLEEKAGIYLGSIAGVTKPKVTIIGGGEVGVAAANQAEGLGCDVTVLDRSPAQIARLDREFKGTGIKVIMSDAQSIWNHVVNSDVVVSGVYIAGAKAPKLITTEMLNAMKPGRGVVDVAIDQGGSVECFDQATTHANPVRMTDKGVWVYSVANMPGAVPQTSTKALTNSTMQYALKLAGGVEEALLDDKDLRKGLNTYKGQLTYKAVGEALGLPWVTPENALGIK